MLRLLRRRNVNNNNGPTGINKLYFNKQSKKKVVIKIKSRNALNF